MNTMPETKKHSRYLTNSLTNANAYLHSNCAGTVGANVGAGGINLNAALAPEPVGSIAFHRGDDARLFHGFNQSCRSVITNSQFPLYR